MLESGPDKRSAEIEVKLPMPRQNFPNKFIIWCLENHPPQKPRVLKNNPDAKMQAPVLVMNTQSGERQTGRKAQLSNIAAAKT